MTVPADAAWMSQSGESSYGDDVVPQDQRSRPRGEGRSGGIREELVELTLQQSMAMTALADGAAADFG